MSSSSIEVMGGGEGSMMLMESDNVGVETMEEQELHTLESAEPSFFSDEMEVEDDEGNEDGFSSLGLPPGSLLFSPQDVVSSPLSKKRGRGRGRGKGLGSKKGTALTIKLEDGVDYSRINLPVACEICGRIMANGKILVQHMTTHVRNKELQCPHCPKSFSKMVQLQGHLVFHGIQKQFECPICHQRFSRQDCVRVHMRLHDKSKCVFCVVCHKAFLTLGALNIHMRIHRGEKPFKCHLCGKCFTQKNHVITHIKRHTKMASSPFSKKLGPRMFQCEHCPRSFIRLSDYERHVQWNHGAVADTNMVDKQNNENLLIDKYSGDSFASIDDFIPPSETLNRKVKKKGLGIGFRRTMCTIGTQTDEEGGRIIIPRQYQNASSMTTSSTQVSAPPTPRPTEEELYENDIFDEGMDRNYSSDEDDIVDDDRKKDQIVLHRDSEISTSEYPQPTYVSSSSQDDAFDAVLGKSKPVEELKVIAVLHDVKDDLASVDNVETVHSDVETGNDIAEVLSSEPNESPSNVTKINHGKVVEEDISVDLELASGNSSELLISESTKKLKSSELPQNAFAPKKLQESSVEARNKPPLPQIVQKMPDPRIPKLLSKKVNPKITKPVITQSLKATFSSAKEPKMQNIEKGEAEPMIRVPLNDSNKKSTGAPNVQHHAKILDTFNTKNWKGRTQGRVRGRGRVKGVIGLTGATHLRLIRKSMMNFISEKVEEMNEKEKEPRPVHKKIAVTPKSSIMAAKRQGKTKQHSADFVCDLRSCETCRPNQAQEIAEDSSSDSEIGLSESQPQTSKSINSGAPKDQSQKLLQFLISGDASNLQGTEFRLLNEIKSYDTTGFNRGSDSGSIYVPSAATIANLPNALMNEPSVRERINITNHLHDKNEFFSAISTGGDDIISPPVELQAFCIPTYSCKLCGREFRFEGKLHRHIEAVHQRKEIFSPDVKPGRGTSKYIEYEGTDLAVLCKPAEDSHSTVMAQNQNPEIEALRSEWDDDDDDDDDEDGDLDLKESSGSVPRPSTSQILANQPSTTFQRKPHLVMNPIITREIVATTNTVTDVYIRGVRMNINKLTGLAGNSPVEFVDNYYVKKSNLAEEVAPAPTLTTAEKEIDTLDTKCRRLLEKLFDHELLIQSGLYDEHVSVVLGRILQHYGVKMIEDYGQGQYEVLKYNLWRLIEWKVTMEQMEEFYTEGKSVEEMMDDIMNGRVPIIAHHELLESRSEHDQTNSHSQENQIETVQISDGHLVLSQVANVLSGQLNLGDGVTQVVLAQDVSPELLQGAHIVTIDPATGQVLSQVTADQVILADSVSDELGQQIQTINGQVVVTEGQTITVTSLPPGSIVSNNSTTTSVQFSHISEDGHILNPTISQSRMEKHPNS